MKVVNTAGTTQRINVQINGTKSIRSTGEAVVLAANNLDETNSLTEPNKIVPRTEKVDGLSTSFTRAFPAYSVTVMKLKTR